MNSTHLRAAIGTALLCAACVGESPGSSSSNDAATVTSDAGRHADAGGTLDADVAVDVDAAGPADSPVAINGQLHVCGTKLCNQYDNPIQLRGMSTHGLQWYGWGKCVTPTSLDALVDDWGADIVRLSLYVQEGGYETDPEGFTDEVDLILDELFARGVYTLIDWHMLTPGDPWDNVEHARAYFTHMAGTYGDRPNVIYEIANEPNGVSWSRISSYADEIIPVIRALDPDGIVIVGTRAWSSFGLSEGGGPQEVIDAPVEHDNVMYGFHFYAASHGSFYRDGVFPAAAALPIFVTEWGTQEASGDGANDFTSAQAYVDWMADNQISWTSWNFSDDFRSGAVLTEGTCASDGPYGGANLKPAGEWVRARIQSPPDDFPTD